MDYPRITIVTPSYNQGEYLEKTIKSVLDQGYPNLEYFIVDGGSSDDSVAVIKRYADRLDWWVSEPDHGQTHAIAKGFARATGDIVNWVNSDDFLEPGALSRVAEAWRESPQAAAWVGGCRRIDEHGRELNVLYANSLDRENLGHNWNGWQIYQPACFLNRRVVEQAGGLEIGYQYAMDQDLYFRMLDQAPFVCGRGVWANALIHSGAKTQHSRMAMHKEIIGIRTKYGFYEGAKVCHDNHFKGGTWRFVVPEDLRRGEREAKAANGIAPGDLSGVHICMTSYCVPGPDTSSSNLRVHEIMKIMAGLGARLTLIYTQNTDKDPEYIEYLRGLGIDCLRLTHLDVEQHLAALGGLRPDVLWTTNIWGVNYLRFVGGLAQQVRRSMPGTRIVMDTMDFHAKKYMRKYKFSHDSNDLQIAKDFLELEKQYYPLADSVVLVTDSEIDTTRENVPGCPPMSVIPNVHHLPQATAPQKARMHFAFLGNYNVNHNCDGVGWFAHEVFPHILKRLPGAEFHILGMHAERVFTVPPGGPVKVRGYVRDVEEALQEYRVFVCPLTYGAGMKGKLGSAAAAGLPFVTTSIGAEGMPLEDGGNCFIADEPEEFALKCVHLHRDPVAWWNFSLKSRRMIAGQAGIRSVSEQLLELVQGLVSGRKSLGAENVAV